MSAPGRDAAVAIGLAALRRSLEHLDPGTGLVALPGRPSKWGARSDGLEGIARTMLLWGYLEAGTTRVTSRETDLLRQALVAGTASGRRGWPGVRESRQVLVEAASLALAMRVTGDRLLDGLTPRERQAFDAWLRSARDSVPPRNNWVLFARTIAEYQIGNGSDDGRGAAIVAAADRDVEGWYAGGGWYTDGPGRVYDYYNAWAFHYYLPLSAHLSGDRDDVARRRVMLDDYLGHLSCAIDDDGAPVLHGRSLVYRFAAAAPFAVRALLGEADRPELLGELWRRCLGYFDGDALRSGRLPLGWRDEWPGMAQRYSGPASPLWAFKSFAALLLPPEHPFWSGAGEVPADGTHASPVGLLAVRASGVSQLLNHGTDHQKGHGTAYFRDDENYALLGYSSVTAPGYGLRLDLETPGGKRAQRGVVHVSGTADDRAASWHRPSLPRRGFGSPLLDRGRLAFIGPRVREVPGSRVEEASVRVGGAVVHAIRFTGLRGWRVRVRGWMPSGRGGLEERLDEAGLSHVIRVGTIWAGLRGVHGVDRIEPVYGGAASPLGVVGGGAALKAQIRSSPQLLVAVSWLARGAPPAEVDVRVGDDGVELRNGEDVRTLTFDEIWPRDGEKTDAD